MLYIILISMLAMYQAYIMLTPSYTVFPNKDCKLCTNCRHFIPSPVSDSYGKCQLYPLLTEDLRIEVMVRGNVPMIDVFYILCTEARKSENICGEYAKYFENKN